MAFLKQKQAAEKSFGFSANSLLDAHIFLARWRDQRARQTSILVSYAAAFFLVICTPIDWFYGTNLVVATDMTALLGCVTTIIWTPRTKSPKSFSWLPMYLLCWLNSMTAVYITGGIHSPFVGPHLGLFYVAGLVVQTNFSPRLILTFTIVNVIFWFILDEILSSVSQVPLPFAFVTTILMISFAAIIACISALLMTEKNLAQEVVQSMASLAETRVLLAKATEGNAIKDAFLANISHEIRTPLTAIMGFSSLLSETDLGPHERDLYCDLVQRNGEQLANLINGILDVSQISASSMDLHVEPIDLRSFLEACMQDSLPQAEAKNLALNWSIKPDASFMLEIDARRLRQIISHLIDNAVRFTDEGLIHLHAERMRRDGREVLIITIRDTGRGIDQKTRDRLFQPFNQEDDSLTREHQGAGLGLALSHSLARLMGGTLSLGSTSKTEGTVFNLVLPLHSPTSHNFVAPNRPVSMDSAAL